MTHLSDHTDFKNKLVIFKFPFVTNQFENIMLTHMQFIIYAQIISLICSW